MHDLLKQLDENEIAFFLKSPDGRYLSMNGSGARMIGKNIIDVIGKNDFELFESASAKIMTERDNYILNVVKTSSYDSVANSAGNWMLFHSCKVATADRSGDLIGLVGLSVNITATRDRSKIALINEAKDRLAQDPFACWNSVKAYLEHNLAPTTSGSWREESPALTDVHDSRDQISRQD